MLIANYKRHILKFAFSARTSREIFHEKETYCLEIFDDKVPDVKGVGEIAVFPSLQPSFVSMDNLLLQLDDICRDFDAYVSGEKLLPQNSAIRFGIESALSSLKRHSMRIQNVTNFRPIIINGLVWMDTLDNMRKQAFDKINQGFRCIKFKIGAHDFDSELSLLDELRRKYPPSKLQIRVDANGAFDRDDVMLKLKALSKYQIHSIEQPLPRDSEMTPYVCANSPIPIALDEDMIERWWSDEKMTTWLQTINPAFIVVKPSLIGGFEMADKWIRVADKLNIKWWVTSALESNLGLEAIARWLLKYPSCHNIPQGLGTGNIYLNNFPSAISLQGDKLMITG